MNQRYQSSWLTVVVTTAGILLLFSLAFIVTRNGLEQRDVRLGALESSIDASLALRLELSEQLTREAALQLEDTSALEAAVAAFEPELLREDAASRYIALDTAIMETIDQLVISGNGKVRSSTADIIIKLQEQEEILAEDLSSYNLRAASFERAKLSLFNIPAAALLELNEYPVVRLEQALHTPY